jgi:DnaJ family protein C protein 8
MLDASATDEEIRKQFKAFSIVLHPDKCKDPKAKDAWHVI